MSSLTAATEWSTKSVFVSSTFLDMQAERDLLRDFVFPEIAEGLRAQACELVAVDLRWGVETAGLSEEGEREAHVLQVLRDEVLRCRPFIIVLLGDRYGWVPPPSQLRALQTETERWAAEERVSVTALEIELGAFAAEAEASRCYFYLREPLPYEEMPREVAARYSDAYSGDDEAAALEGKLRSLKERIQDTFGERGRVRSYKAGWDRDRRRVVDLDELRAAVTEDLLRELAGPVSYEPEALTWDERERRALSEFAAVKRSGFVGRETLLEGVVEQAVGGGPGRGRGLCLTGESGAGKSALWAELCGLLAGRALVLASAAGVTPLSSSPHAVLRRWVGELSTELGVEGGLADGASPSEVRLAFEAVVGRVPAEKAVVVVLDALTEMERTAGARELAWLPDPLPENVFLIATALPGPEAAACVRRAGVVEQRVPGLDEAEAAAVVAALCRKGGKPEVNPSVREAILGKRREDGAFAYANPLWLTLAVEHLVRLSEDDFRRAADRYTGRGDAQVVALLLDMVAEYPAEVAGMYAFMLAHAERAFGEKEAQSYAAAITVSRSGWRESDLTSFVAALTGERPDPLAMASLRRGFGMHLVVRGDPERLDFAHQQMRQAVSARYLAAAADTQRVHRAILDHLRGLPGDDPVRQSEMMPHLLGADDKAGAADYLTMGASGPALDLAWAALAEAIVGGGDMAGNEAAAWTLAVPSAGGYDDYQRPIRRRLLHQQYGFDLAMAIERQGGSSDLAADFLRAVVAGLRAEDEESLGAGVGDLLTTATGTLPDTLLGTCLFRLGEMQARAGRYEDALASSAEACKLLQSLHDRNPTPQQGTLLRFALGARADLLAALGRAQEAKALRSRARDLLDQVAPSESADVTDRAKAAVVRLQSFMDGKQVGDARALYEANKEVLDGAFLGEGWSGGPEAQVRACAVLGELLMGQDEYKERASDYLRKGIEVGERLYYDAPEVSSGYDLVGLYARQAKLLTEADRNEEAVSFVERELALLEGLAASDPSPGRKTQVGGAHYNVGGLLIACGRNEEGDQHLRAAEDLLSECYYASPSAEGARQLAMCYMARGATLPATAEGLGYWKAAEGLFEGLWQFGSMDAADLLIRDEIQRRLAGHEDEPPDTAGLATIEPLTKAAWAQPFVSEDAEETATMARLEFNLPALEVEFLRDPKAARARPLMESYGRLVYMAATTSRDPKEGEGYATRMHDLLEWAQEHSLDLGPDAAAIRQALEGRPTAAGAEHLAATGHVRVGPLWLPAAIAAAMEMPEADAAYLEVARRQEQIARETGMQEGVQLSLDQQARLQSGLDERTRRTAAEDARARTRAAELLKTIRPLAERFRAEPSAEVAYELGERYYELVSALERPALETQQRAAARCLLAVLEWLVAKGMEVTGAEEMLRELRAGFAGETVPPGELCDVDLD